MEILLVIVVAILVFYWFKRHKAHKVEQREKFITTYIFPKKINDQIIKIYPHLTQQDTQKVLQGLREYFIICYMADKQMVSMPSQVVDVAWHEFILFTKRYETFCQKVFGRFLHHTPVEAMQSQKLAQDGIKLAWRLSCQREGIDPRSPDRLPLLFALDGLLDIPDGFKYSLNCAQNGDYCAGHIGCGSSCGSSSDSSGSDFGGGSSCGSGCGGD